MERKRIGHETLLVATRIEKDISSASEPRVTAERKPSALAPVQRFMASRYFPAALQWPAALLFGLIIVYGLFGAKRASVNPATLLTWSLWWPLLPLGLFLTARVWCTICPMPLAVQASQRLSPVPRRAPGQLVRRYGIWVMIGTFLLLTWWDRAYGIRNNPELTALLLLSILGAAVLMALVFQRNVWCRYLCPIGAFTGLYATLAPVELRASPDRCQTCTTLDCYRGNARIEGCPFVEFPRTLDTNRNCSLCAQCIKACPKESLSLRPRLPGRELLLMRKVLSGEAVLVLLLAGLVFMQTVDMTVAWGSYMRWLMEDVGLGSYRLGLSMTMGVVLASVLALYWLASVWAGRVGGISFGKAFAAFGYAYIPIVLGPHLGHNLGHLFSEAPAAGTVLWQQLRAPFALLEPGSPPTISISVNSFGLAFAAIGVVASLYLAWRMARRHAGALAIRTFAPHAGLMLLLALGFFWIFTTPMNPVHTH